MDKNEDIIIPKKSSKVPATSSDSTVTKKNMNKPLLITLVVAGVFIVVLIVAIIILINKAPDSGSENIAKEDTEKVEDSKTVYTTPEGIEDAKADYQEYLEKEKAAAETEEETFDAELRIIANKISDKEYDEALSRLEALSLENRSAAELFRFYNVFSRLYEETGDVEKYNEYVDLRTEQLKLLSAEEDE